MSNTALTWAWSQQLSSMTEQCVLAALADYADDAGRCWPSVDTLAARCSGNRTTIMRILQRLSNAGLLVITYEKSRYGRKAVYQLNQSHSATSGAMPPVAERDQNQSHSATSTSRIECSDWSHSATLTIIEPKCEPSYEPSKARAKAKKVDQPNFVLPDWVPAEAWNNYVADRKARKKPLTPQAAKLAVAKLKELTEQGHDAEAVLNQSVMNGWTSLYPLKNGTSGKPAGRSGSRVAAGFEVAQMFQEKGE